MIIPRSGAWTGVLALGAACAPLLAGPLPDIASVPADLEVPPLSGGPPAAGKRVKQVLPAKGGTAVHHVLYLPADWTPDAARKFPVLVEFAGNGPYRNKHGDVS
ncbi:MAG: hypothetical protein HKO57_00545, partial [Akkermansiaceae bacterium]|nr:hypothetical protein [Akkermansiaceae bacterium]